MSFEVLSLDGRNGVHLRAGRLHRVPQREPLRQKHFGAFQPNHPGAQAKHVAVVAEPGTGPSEAVMDHSGPDSLEFIGGDTHADSGAAEENAPAAVRVGLNLPGQALGDVRVIGVVRFQADAQVHRGVSQLSQKLHERRLVGYGGIVAGNVDSFFHGRSPSLFRDVCVHCLKDNLNGGRAGVLMSDAAFHQGLCPAKFRGIALGVLNTLRGGA